MVVSTQPTRMVLKELRRAGFVPDRTVGSHTTWKGPSGRSVTVPDGHREISPGVYRKVKQAIQDENGAA